MKPMKKQNVKKEEKLTIKPGTPYDWSTETVFKLSGEEFGVLFNITERYINSQEYAHAIGMSNLHSILLKKLEDGLQAGEVIERKIEE